MNAVLVDSGEDFVVFNITRCSRAELENRLHLFFVSENLPLKQERGEEKIYQRGNKLLRLLGGVLVKYFRLVVTVRHKGEVFSIHIYRDMSLAMSGGLIGITASRKEFERLMDLFKLNFNGE